MQYFLVHTSHNLRYLVTIEANGKICVETENLFDHEFIDSKQYSLSELPESDLKKQIIDELCAQTKHSRNTIKKIEILGDTALAMIRKNYLK